MFSLLQNVIGELPYCRKQNAAFELIFNSSICVIGVICGSQKTLCLPPPLASGVFLDDFDNHLIQQPVELTRRLQHDEVTVSFHDRNFV